MLPNRPLHPVGPTFWIPHCFGNVRSALRVLRLRSRDGDLTAIASRSDSQRLNNRMISFSKFILKNMEPILLEWEKFAATLVPEAQRMDHAMLRDHGEKMLQAIARDVSKPESEKQRAEKS